MTVAISVGLISLPFDNAKTKVQKMKAGPDGKMPYKEIVDCMRKEVRLNGIFGPWVGLPTYTMRMAPHSMISLTVAEQLKKRFY